MSANTKPTTFAELEGKQRTRGSGCPLCGAAKNRGNVGPSLQSFGPKGITDGKRIRSKSVSMCEPCCVKVYMKLEEVLLREVGMEHLIGVEHK